MVFHDRLLRAKERWAFADGYCATFPLKLRAFIRAFFERRAEYVRVSYQIGVHRALDREAQG